MLYLLNPDVPSLDLYSKKSVHGGTPDFKARRDLSSAQCLPILSFSKEEVEKSEGLEGLCPNS